jgi:hypothetical protein
MKSFSKIHSAASRSHLQNWNVADLDVESNVLPPQVDIEQIMTLFDGGKENHPNQSNQESHLAFHPKGSEVELANWFPDDLNEPIGKEEIPAVWEFMNPSKDFTEIPEQQILQEKFEAEKERVELIKQARVEANEILHAAQLEAEKIVLNARNEIDQAKMKAYQAAHKEMQGALAATHAMVEEARFWQTSLMETGEQILTDMMKEIAQTMFGEGVNLDVNALQVNLNRIMESAQRLGDLNMFLNPRTPTFWIHPGVIINY